MKGGWGGRYLLIFFADEKYYKEQEKENKCERKWKKEER
jgi:hypothetical protein